MKAQNLIAAALFAAAICTPAIAAKNSIAPAYAFPVKEAVSSTGVVLPGTVRSEVREVLGTSSSRPSENVWVYADGFRSLNIPQPNEMGCTALVITFSGARVADMKLVNPAAAKQIVACTEAGRPVKILVEKPMMVASNTR